MEKAMARNTVNGLVHERKPEIYGGFDQSARTLGVERPGQRKLGVPHSGTTRAAGPRQRSQLHRTGCGVRNTGGRALGNNTSAVMRAQPYRIVQIASSADARLSWQTPHAWPYLEGWRQAARGAPSLVGVDHRQVKRQTIRTAGLE